MRKLALATITAGLALAALPGCASANAATNQHFTLLTVGSGHASVIAHGVINGDGTDSNNRREVPEGHPFMSTFTFAQGQLTSTVSDAGPPKVRFDRLTCETHVTAKNNVVLTGGTGIYAHATGGGTAVADVTIYGGRGGDGTCLGRSSRPVLELTVTEASYTVNLN